MRELNLKERDFVSGGDSAPPVPPNVPVLPPTTVTGVIPPSNSGDLMFMAVGTLALIGGGGGGAGGGGGGSSSGSIVYDTPAIQQLLKGIIQEMQADILAGDIPSDWIESGVNVANLSASFLNANIAGGFDSFETYSLTGFSPNGGADVNAPIQWQNVDWAAFANQGESYPQALTSLFNYLGEKHG